jgi:AcrR family transcriptional regulator
VTSQSIHIGGILAEPSGREKLIAAGTKLFGEHGFTGASVRDIAGQAGVSIGLIRSHFGSKEGLRREINDHVLQEIEALYSSVTEHSGTKPLGRVVEDAVEWLERDRGLMLYIRTAFMEQTSCSQEMFDRLLKTLRSFVSQNKENGFLQDGVDEEWAAIYLLFDLLGPAIIEPFAETAFGASMYARPMIERRNAFGRRLMTRGFLEE